MVHFSKKLFISKKTQILFQFLNIKKKLSPVFANNFSI